jgi:hypothetical protein
MAKFSLIPFDNESAPKIFLDCELNFPQDSLFISYKLTGDIEKIELGREPRHERVIKLWEKTCFELFIKNNRDEYMEFNFSPVFEWNAFFFPKKGEALTEWKKMDSVKFDILDSLDVFEVIVEINKKKFPENFFEGCQAGITTVIKEKTGNLSYWALSHHDQRPNFHNFKSFTALV